MIPVRGGVLPVDDKSTAGGSNDVGDKMTDSSDSVFIMIPISILRVKLLLHRMSSINENQRRNDGSPGMRWSCVIQNGR